MQVKPDPDQAAAVPDPAEWAVQRRLDFHLGDDGGFDRDERDRLPLGKMARPRGRQWARPGVPGARTAERQTA